LKDESLDRTLWRTRFGRGCVPVVRHYRIMMIRVCSILMIWKHAIRRVQVGSVCVIKLGMTTNEQNNLNFVTHTIDLDRIQPFFLCKMT
jgi:hypothetical protein